ncbi:MAG: diguanylate cyclase [Bacillota bacterium]
MNSRVLIVEDNPNSAKLLGEILGDEGYQVYSVDQGLSILNLVYEIKPNIILLDIMMPELDGFEICKLLKTDSETKDIPIIMITAKTDSKDIRMALELGAFDYIKKPVDEVEVIARVRSALRFKEYHDKLKEMTMKDGLTGVYNHRLLIELFEKEYTRQIRKGGNIAFIMIDIDHFKRINDTYGHTAGDMIIREVANILTTMTRRSDIVGRYGGEEFGIFVSEINLDNVYKFCEKIRKKIEDYEFNIGDRIIHITISMGVCLKEASDNISYLDIIKISDAALYSAKENGRNKVELISNTYCFY